MTKSELIKGIQNEVSINIPQKDVAEILDAQAKVVADAVKAGDEVTIPGVCKVKSKDVPERTGKVMLGANKGANKGDTWVKPAHKEACVKIVKALKEIFA